MKLNPVQTQQVKTAFLAYSQGAPKVSDVMMYQFIATACPGATAEQCAEVLKGKMAPDGCDLSQWFQVINSNENFQLLCINNYPPAPTEQKSQVDGLEMKAAKGFVD